MPKVVIAGSGYCGAVIAYMSFVTWLGQKEHAILQTDADVTSFDGGYGLILLKWWDRKSSWNFL
jgi:1,4-dihydroxy-2-naphthoyl-CoA synthase